MADSFTTRNPVGSSQGPSADVSRFFKRAHRWERRRLVSLYRTIPNLSLPPELGDGIPE
jgi:hypothetical protein